MVARVRAARGGCALASRESSTASRMIIPPSCSRRSAPTATGRDAAGQEDPQGCRLANGGRPRPTKRYDDGGVAPEHRCRCLPGSQQYITLLNHAVSLQPADFKEAPREAARRGGKTTLSSMRFAPARDPSHRTRAEEHATSYQLVPRGEGRHTRPTKNMRLQARITYRFHPRFGETRRK